MGYHHLTQVERCQIYTLRSTGFTQKYIAEHIKVHPSTISREIQRNTGNRGYRYQQAHNTAVARRKDASSTPRKMNGVLIGFIQDKLIKEQWSPEQISGVLRANGTFISHERIYQHVWEDKHQGGLLYRQLRHRGKKYCYKGPTKAGRGCIPNRVDITERSKIVEDKSRLGDWEADTIIGKQHKGAILSLVDRKSKYTMLRKLTRKTAEQVCTGVKDCFDSMPLFKAHTMTFDNGKEFSGHSNIAKVLNIQCYFATPYRSWERGLNEHTNGLVRQYFPKKTDFTTLTEEDIQIVENKLNNRPRKVLGFRTPREVLLGTRRPQKIALHG